MDSHGLSSFCQECQPLGPFLVAPHLRQITVCQSSIPAYPMLFSKKNPWFNPWFSHSITIFPAKLHWAPRAPNSAQKKVAVQPPGLEGSAARAARAVGASSATDVGGDVAGLWRGECPKCNWDEKDRERLGRLRSRLEKDWRLLVNFLNAKKKLFKPW